MTMIPKTTSKIENEVLRIKGPTIATKKEVVLMMAKAVLTFEALMLPKKQIQCAAVNSPTPM